MRTPVYLDYAATTPVDPRVAEQMVACLQVGGTFGNPASRSHLYGWQAEEAVENARSAVAEAINADPREIVWTSGATESDNLAIKGVALARAANGRHVITSSIEHKAVLDSCQFLEKQGFELTYVAPDVKGRVHPQQIEHAIRADTVLVSLMHVNNETGVANDIAAVGRMCRERGIAFHVDAAQSAGKLAIDVRAMEIDLLSVSAHKIYGPKGSGFLYVRRGGGIELEPFMHGGGHERGMRSGTLATHQIVGLAEALRLSVADMTSEQAKIKALRESFWQRVSALKGAVLNGCMEHQVAGILNVSFGHVDGENLLMSLGDLAVSSGSACTSASLEPSYVLTAMGLPAGLAHSSLRFSFGRFTTQEEVDFAADKVCEAVERLQAGASPRVRV